MKYSNYEKKVRMAKFRKDLLKSYKFWIIGGVTLSGATALTLLGTKGITSVDNVPTQIVYGESLEPKLSAFLSSASLEYKADGEEDWKSDKPSLVGKYQVRSKSSNGFGGTTYSAAKEFEIVARPITVEITNSSIVYGDAPKLRITSSYSLVGGDAIGASSLNFDHMVTGESCTASIDQESFRINRSSDGLDITDCYDPTFIEKNVTLLKRNLSLEFDSAAKTYDGTSLSCNTYSLANGTSLAEGDAFISGEGKTIQDVGSLENKIEDYRIVHLDDSEDVTALYNVSTSFGELTINPVNVTVKTNSVNRAYDGTDLSDELQITNLEEIQAAMVGGDKFVFDDDFSYANRIFTDGEELQNVVSYHIENKEGDAISSNNYHFTDDFGTIKIGKRDLSYQTASYSGVYDGASHVATWENGKVCSNISGLVEGDTFNEEVSSPTSISTLGEVKNTGVKVSILNAKNEDVTPYYNLKADYGTLCLKKRKVHFQMPTYRGVYDGQDHVLGLSGVSLDSEDYDGLKVGDIYAIEFKNSDGTVTDSYSISEAKSYSIEGIASIHIYNGIEDVSDAYYEISYDWNNGSTISPRAIQVDTSIAESQYENGQLNGGSFAYEDSAVSFADPENHPLGTPLVNGDKASSTFTYTSLQDSGEEKLEASCLIDLDIKNASGDSVKKNYDVSYAKEQSCIIDKKIVDVALSQDVKTEVEYGTDSLALSTENFSIVDSASEEDFSASVKSIEVGLYNDQGKEVSEVHLNDEGESTLQTSSLALGSYTLKVNDITYEDNISKKAVLTRAVATSASVGRATITVYINPTYGRDSIPGANPEYNGESINLNGAYNKSSTGVVTIDGNLMSGHYVHLASQATTGDAAALHGSNSIAVTPTVKSGSSSTSSDVSSNYKITNLQNGSSSFTQNINFSARHISLETPSVIKYYDGSKMGTVSNEATPNSYDEETKTYTSKCLADDIETCNFKAGSLAKGDTIEIAWDEDNRPTTVSDGEKENAIESFTIKRNNTVIYSYSAEDGLAKANEGNTYYQLDEISFGKLEVLTRPIRLIRKSYSAVYSGAAKEGTSFRVTPTSDMLSIDTSYYLDASLIDNFTITATYTSNLQNVIYAGNSCNIIDLLDVSVDGSDGANYEILYKNESGSATPSFSITKKDLSITWDKQTLVVLVDRDSLTISTPCTVEGLVAGDTLYFTGSSNDEEYKAATTSYENVKYGTSYSSTTAFKAGFSYGTSYSVQQTGIKIMRGGVDVTGCYNLTTKQGFITLLNPQA